MAFVDSTCEGVDLRHTEEEGNLPNSREPVLCGLKGAYKYLLSIIDLEGSTHTGDIVSNLVGAAGPKKIEP